MKLLPLLMFPNYVRFEVVPVPGQDVTQVFGLVTEPKEEIYVQLNPRE